MERTLVVVKWGSHEIETPSQRIGPLPYCVLCAVSEMSTNRSLGSRPEVISRRILLLDPSGLGEGVCGQNAE